MLTLVNKRTKRKEKVKNSNKGRKSRLEKIKKTRMMMEQKNMGK